MTMKKNNDHAPPTTPKNTGKKARADNGLETIEVEDTPVVSAGTCSHTATDNRQRTFQHMRMDNMNFLTC